MELTRKDLGEIKLFHGVQPDSILGLLQSCPTRELSAKEPLIEPGEESECLYVVLEGKLSVHLESADDEAVLELTRGDSVGELSLIDNRPRSALVVANEPTRVMVISREIFWSLANSSPGVAVNLLIVMSARLRGNNDTILESLKEQEKYRINAMVDGLTGLHNRRWLDEYLRRQMGRAKMGGELLSIAMIDVDHFKKFNDTFGHQAGDFVLTSVARCIGSSVRPTDLSARYGGEEFTIIFPRTSGVNAMSASNRVREAVGSLVLITQAGIELPRITISIGVAEMADKQEMQSLVEAADRALYIAKESGRNKVCQAPG